MIDIPDEIADLLDKSSYQSKSRWVKTISVRMRVFNGQIFDGIYAKHCKSNADMNYAYLQKNFDKLHNKAYQDDSISNDEYFEFCDKYDSNLQLLYKKELTDKKSFPLNEKDFVPID